jgi:YD repeat-containing protein
LTAISLCATGTAPSCVGTADEVKTTIAFGTPGVANNLAPTSVSTGAGDGSLTATTLATYDNIGNLASIQGPLGGAQTTVYHYDANRHMVGFVGPDPDGAGPLKNRAALIAYSAGGLVSSTSQGTVNSQSNADWASFATLKQVAFVYNSLDQKIKASLISGGATQAVTQYDWNLGFMPSCVALRMNPAVFGTLPSAACTLGTAGADGPDRISLPSFAGDDQPSAMTEAYGTASPVNSWNGTYSPNGNLLTAADGKGNLTTYAYDGVDRRTTTYYPTPSNGSVSSTTDYEKLTYDAASRVTQDRRRDGQVISFTSDALGRVTTGVNGATYVYDNLNRLTSATLSGKINAFQYDALGR